jgi:putative Mg2+ transporter-C (MgtC) family protein
MLLGALIGLDRERAQKPAGLRTQMLVAGAATLLVRLGDTLLDYFEATRADGSLVQSDPIRIVEAVIVGVSFIGAGTIIRRQERKSVEGITTAASLLFCASIGIAVGLSQFVIAGGATVFALVTLWLLNRLSHTVRASNLDGRKNEP